MVWKKILEAAKGLDEMPELVLRLASLYNHRPSEGSKASHELLNCCSQEALEVAYGHGARQLQLVSPDLMSGLRRALTPSPNSLVCTPWICARGVLESCSTGVWLLDPEIDPKERVSRSLNLRLQEQNLQKRLARKEMDSPFDVEGSGELIRKIEHRIHHLRNEAGRLGINEKKNRRGQLSGFGSGTVSISVRIASTLKSDLDYAMLSSVVHGNEFATLSVSLKMIEYTNDRIISIPSLDPKSAVYLVFLVFEWYARVSWTYFTLFGWDLAKLKSILENQYDRADINDEFRFWRD